MDFHSLCQKIDVNGLRAKLPALPALPAMPHIKLPKSMAKIKSRKIFRSSRENINRKESQKQQGAQNLESSQTHLAAPGMPHATFIKPTPTRISTISSLMHEDSVDGCTYRSADSIDDFSPLARRYSCAGDMTTTATTTTAAGMSPLRATTQTTDRLTFSQKLHQSYKDLSEFRIRHIFAKKTVVRKDDIQVAHYVERYKEDLVRETREQETRDKAIAENYRFRFKHSQQNMEHSNSVTPDDSPKARKINRTVGEHSGDESGMEATPPPRKPGIASTRFARVRSPPLRQSSSERDEDEPIRQPEKIPSALWSTKINRIQVNTDGESETDVEKERKTAKSRFNYKARMRRLASYISTDAETTQDPNEKGSNTMLHRLKSLGKRHENSAADLKIELKDKPAPDSPYSTDQEQTSPKLQTKESPSNKTFNVIKNNFKRLQKSIKTRQQSDNDDEANTGNSPSATTKPTTSKNEHFVSRLRRFRSRDLSTADLDEADAEGNNAKATPTPQSPIRQAISNKLEHWKKSFKKKPKEKEDGAQQTSEAETSPEKEKPKRADTLIKKLRHIRGRKQPTGSNDELEATQTDNDAGEESQQTTAKSKTSRFTEARQRTLKKVNEKMQQIKFFHKSQEQVGEAKVENVAKARRYQSDEDDNSDEETSEGKTCHEISPRHAKRYFTANVEDHAEPAHAKSLPLEHSTFSIPGANASWTSRPPLLTDSMDSDTDAGGEFPRVLIHQDNTDCFESTLIIAVTRSPATASAKITELKEDEYTNSKQSKTPESDWIPNKNIIASFLETTPPGSSRRKKSMENSSPKPPAALPPAAPKRRKSMESNSNSDSDSTKIARKSRSSSSSSRRSSKSSQAGLISIDERSEAWKVKTKINEDQTMLYKAKSIDIFEKNILKGGALTAFEDFDDELKNEPVLKIKAKRTADSFERESSDDTADDDNSSRITKISANRFREGSLDSIIEAIKEKPKAEIASAQKTLPQYANSRESLVANFDENEENEDSRAEEDDDSDDRPPSATPSPPPKMSPPPPPLPLRQPSTRLTKSKSTDSNDSVGLPPPPLPKSKPPPPKPSTTFAVKRTTMAPPPPRIPERTSSMPRAPKPLVKTSSLRLVYREQVKPADVGKVNKLISRFEPTEANQTTQRPRIMSRRMPAQYDSEEYSDDEEDFATIADKLKERYANIKIERDTTPTSTNTPKISTPKSNKIDTPEKIINRFGGDDGTMMETIRIKREIIAPMIVTTTDEDNNTRVLTQQVFEPFRPILDLPLDNNANFSHPNSEYGSPLEYPSSLRSSLEAIPILEKRDATEQQQQRLSKADRRSRRSMPRDNDNFYSFDSDEENSYYSISSTGSNRYVVEL